MTQQDAINQVFGNLNPNKGKVQLQSYGWTDAKPAGEFKVNDIMIWNWGYKSVVTEITKETEKSIWISQVMLDSNGNQYGKTYNSRYLKTRLIACRNNTKN